MSQKSLGYGIKKIPKIQKSSRKNRYFQEK